MSAIHELSALEGRQALQLLQLGFPPAGSDFVFSLYITVKPWHQIFTKMNYWLNKRDASDGYMIFHK